MTTSLRDSFEIFLGDYEKIANENRARLSFFFELSREFENAGIPFLPLKGLDLLIRAYPSTGMRPMADIDLLIREKDARKVMSVLEAKGFTRRPDEGLTYLHHGRNINLDIIWDFWYFTRPGEMQKIWDDTVIRTFEDHSVRMLHPEDDFLYLTAYVAAHRGVLSETFARDLEFFLEKEGPALDWKKIETKIKALKLHAFLFHALSYAAASGASRIPEDFLNKLRPVAFSDTILLVLLEKIVTDGAQPKVSYLFTFLGYPGFRGKLKLLREKIFPSKWEADIHWGRSSYPAYFLKLIFRPVYLVLRAALSLTHDLFFFFLRKPS